MLRGVLALATGIRCFESGTWLGVRYFVAAGSGLMACCLTAVPAAGAEPFHTPPECWKEARIYHPGPPAADIANRMRLVEMPTAAPVPGEPTVSPNGGYRFWVRNPDTTKPGPWSAGLIIDVERKTRPALLLDDVAQPIQPRWLTEKLIFLRVSWGRIEFSDLILDVEKRELVYNEIARDGQIGFEQAQQACNGRCPCAPTAGEAAPLPSSKPGEAELIGLLQLPAIFGEGETGGVVPAHDPKPVAVYAAADAGAEIVARPAAPDAVVYREIGYEAGAAVVYDRRPGWYRIGLTDGERKGWIRESDAGPYTSVAELLPGRLAYLNEHWNGELWSAPEPGATTRRSSLKHAEERQEYSVEIRETRDAEHGVWLRVALLASDPCAGGEPGVADEGWIPAYAANGRLVAWYHSRGC